MEGEKVLFSYTVSPSQSLRLVVRGDVDETLLLALENQVELLKKLHALAEKKAPRGEQDAPQRGTPPAYLETTAGSLGGYLPHHDGEQDT